MDEEASLLRQKKRQDKEGTRERGKRGEGRKRETGGKEERRNEDCSECKGDGSEWRDRDNREMIQVIQINRWKKSVAKEKIVRGKKKGEEK